MPLTSVPDLDGSGVEAAADEGSGVVGAAAAEGGGDALAGADEAAHDRDLAGVDEREDLRVKGVLDLVFLGRGLLVVVVGEDDVAGVDVDGVHAELGEGGGDHDGAEAFAEADDVVFGARGEFADGADAAEEIVERVEVMVDGELDGLEAVFAGRVRGTRDELGGGPEMARAEGVGDLQRAVAIVLSGRGCSGEQGVGDLAHGGDDDDGPEALLEAAGDDGTGALDGGGVLDGGATELHDDDAGVGRLAHAFTSVLGVRVDRGEPAEVELAEDGEDFGVEDGGSGGPADGVVREQGELPVEEGAGAQAADGGGHAVAAHEVEAGLGAGDAGVAYSTGWSGAEGR